jgi:GNAT superfamily N-acetyltransferase
VIRPIVAGDRERWQVLWAGYLDFYRETLPEATTTFTFDRLCAKADGLFGYVAEAGDALTGLVHAVVHPSTWSRSGYCYLEDLYVDRSARGSGVARALIEAVAAEAAVRGADRVYWHTQEFNGPARSLYDQVARRTSFVVYQR